MGGGIEGVVALVDPPPGSLVAVGIVLDVAEGDATFEATEPREAPPLDVKVGDAGDLIAFSDPVTTTPGGDAEEG